MVLKSSHRHRATAGHKPAPPGGEGSRQGVVAGATLGSAFEWPSPCLRGEFFCYLTGIDLLLKEPARDELHRERSQDHDDGRIMISMAGKSIWTPASPAIVSAR